MCLTRHNSCTLAGVRNTERIWADSQRLLPAAIFSRGVSSLPAFSCWKRFTGFTLSGNDGLMMLGCLYEANLPGEKRYSSNSGSWDFHKDSRIRLKIELLTHSLYRLMSFIKPTIYTHPCPIHLMLFVIICSSDFLRFLFPILSNHFLLLVPNSPSLSCAYFAEHDVWSQLHLFLVNDGFFSSLWLSKILLCIY